MPIALRLHAERAPQRRFVDTPAAVPFWQLAHRYADQLSPELQTVWETFLQDAQAHVATAALRAALASGSLLAVEALLLTAWQQHVETPARQVLPMLLRETVARAAEAALPESARVAPEVFAVQFNVTAPEVLAMIDTYVGTEIQGISQRALLAARAVIRQGFAEGQGVPTTARRLRQFLGLTGRQVQALEAYRAHLRDEGLTATKVEAQVARAARIALRRRAVSVARTESLHAANAGQYALWVAADQQGLWDDPHLRRHWLLTPDARLCPRCRAVVRLNPNGVGLREPFRTPEGGTILHPPLHPQCRCAVRPKLVSARP